MLLKVIENEDPFDGSKVHDCLKPRKSARCWNLVATITIEMVDIECICRKIYNKQENEFMQLCMQFMGNTNIHEKPLRLSDDHSEGSSAEGI